MTAGDQHDAEGGPDTERDAGRATIEVVFLAVLLLIPTMYIMISVVRVQAATFAVTQAARDAGRLLDTAPSIDIGLSQAREAATIALADQHVQADDLSIRFTAPGAACSSGVEFPPTLSAGDSVDVCVTTVISLPGVPTILTGSNNTVTGVYTLHVGEFREPASKSGPPTEPEPPTETAPPSETTSPTDGTSTTEPTPPTDGTSPTEPTPPTDGTSPTEPTPPTEGTS